MYDVLITEFIKLKHTRILLLIPMGALVPVLMALQALNDMHDTIGNSHSWGWLFNTVLIFTNYISPAILAIFTGYVFTRENQDNTMSVLFTYPFSYLKFFLSKLAVIFTITAVIYISSIAFTLISGCLFRYGYFMTGTLLIFFKCGMLSVLLNFLLVPLAAFIGIISRNMLPVTVLGIVHAISLMVVSRISYSTYIPGCIPPLIISAKSLEMGGFLGLHDYVNVDRAFITLLVVFAAFAFISLFHYRNMDVT